MLRAPHVRERQKVVRRTQISATVSEHRAYSFAIPTRRTSIFHSDLRLVPPRQYNRLKVKIATYNASCGGSHPAPSRETKEKEKSFSLSEGGGGLLLSGFSLARTIGFGPVISRDRMRENEK